MSWAAVRPSGFYNDMLEYLNMARRGRVWLLGEGTNRFNPIHGADLADVCVACLEGDSNLERDVGGPEVLTPREAGELAFAALEAPPRYARLPLGPVRAAVDLLRSLPRSRFDDFVWTDPLALVSEAVCYGRQFLRSGGSTNPIPEGMIE